MDVTFSCLIATVSPLPQSFILSLLMVKVKSIDQILFFSKPIPHLIPLDAIRFVIIAIKVFTQLSLNILLALLSHFSYLFLRTHY